MATANINPEKLKAQYAELEAARDQFQEILDVMPDKECAAAVTVRGQLGTLEDQLYSHRGLLKKALTTEEKLQKSSAWDKIAPLVDEAILNNYIGYIIPEQKFIYCKDYGAGQNNVQFNLVSQTQIVRVLNKMLGITIKSKDYNEIIDYFEANNRNYYNTTSSFNNSKWDESQVYNKMTVVREQWVKPDYDYDGPLDPGFGFLLNSVAGGKEENIEHLEKWIAFKYLNPNKTSSIPNIDMGGSPGGNGKGILINLLKTIFTPICVIQAHKEELEKFNSNWEMAVVLYYDEPEEKELAASKLKQATGSEDMRIEKKGIDATMADRNYNFVFSSNNDLGVVKLSGGSSGGEDRRYSVMTTDIVLTDELTRSGMTDKEALKYLDELAKSIVKDKRLVARFLAHCIKKHKIEELDELPALHGEDYKSRFSVQKDNITVAFDKILPIFQKNNCITQTTLCEAVRVLTDNPLHKPKNVADKFKVYLTRNKVKAEVQDRARVDIKWKGLVIDILQQKVVRMTADKLSFDYATISSKEWRKTIKDHKNDDVFTEVNEITADTIINL
jgi:hypothetical protein